MMLMGWIFLIVLVVRLIYRLTVTRDLKQNPDELYIGVGFIAAWMLIYLYIYFSA